MKAAMTVLSFGFRRIFRSKSSQYLPSVYTNYPPRISNITLMLTTVREYSHNSISQNLRLLNLGNIEIKPKSSGLPQIILSEESRPLVVLLEWMNAKEKHLAKFQDFYKSYGFDILRIRLNPWQLMWPSKGSQIVAQDIVDFLLLNPSYSPLLIHAFSVGGYLWGEVLVKLSANVEKHLSVIERISGQVYDSVVDVEEIPPGFPAALFPKNPFLRNTFEKYIRYHMKTFYNESTRYYISARAAFTAGIVKAPSLFIFSDNDPVSTPFRNNIARDQLVALNLPVYTKCFEGSKHVSHFQKYRSEYISELTAFMEKAGLTQPTKLQAKL